MLDLLKGMFWRCVEGAAGICFHQAQVLHIDKNIRSISTVASDSSCLHCQYIFACYPRAKHLVKSMCTIHNPGIGSNQCVQSTRNLSKSNQYLQSTRNLLNRGCASKGSHLCALRSSVEICWRWAWLVFLLLYPHHDGGRSSFCSKDLLAKNIWIGWIETMGLNDPQARNSFNSREAKSALTPVAIPATW